MESNKSESNMGLKSEKNGDLIKINFSNNIIATLYSGDDILSLLKRSAPCNIGFLCSIACSITCLAPE